MNTVFDTLIIGGGQSGLAVARYLKRSPLEFRVLDNQLEGGGAWLHAWQSLHLFSPSEASSLPGWPMPQSANEYPTRDEAIQYLRQYEQKYQIPVERPVKVKDVRFLTEHQAFEVFTDQGSYYSQTVVNATGTWGNPFIPEYPGKEEFEGRQLHSAYYQEPGEFEGQKVMVVGEGNSGAQVLAEVSKWASQTIWVTKKEPRFLPDDVDGRYLFTEATKLYNAKQQGESGGATVFNLGDIVMVPEVKEARERGALKSHRPFERFDQTGIFWPDGTHTAIDAVIWCTGFKPALQHLQSIDVFEDNGRVTLDKDLQSIHCPGLYFVGYGNWTGFASATLIGVGRYARKVAKAIEARQNE